MLFFFLLDTALVLFGEESLDPFKWQHGVMLAFQEKP